MSIQTKKTFKNVSKTVAIALFALLMFTNIKIATMDSSELAKGDISLFGIEVTLFDATDAYIYVGYPTDCSDWGCNGYADPCASILVDDNTWEICFDGIFV